MRETVVHPLTDPRRSPDSTPDSELSPCFSLGDSPPRISVFAACSAAPSPLHHTADTPSFLPTFQPSRFSQHPNLPVAVADSGLGHLPNPQTKCGPRLLRALVPKSGNRNPRHFAGTSLAHLVHATQVVHYWAAARGLYNFFASTSCNIVLSKLNSATNLFSLPFSSWSCFSCRT